MTPSREITPPSGHRHGLLPLADVGSRRFEELCLDIVRLAFPELVAWASLKRTSGVEQYGVDVEGFDERGEPAVVVSAKCYREVNGWDFRVWIQDFVDNLDGHWKDRRIKFFVLAVTHETNDDGMSEAARELSRVLDSRGIKFRLWNTHEISQLLRREIHLVDRYFNRYWVEALSASTATAAPAAPRPVALGAATAAGLLHQALAQVENLLSGPVNAVLGAALDAALAAARAGRSDDLRRWLDEARSQPSIWDGLAAETRARALSAVAMLRLRDGDVPGASTLLDEADRLHEATDASPRALLVRATNGPDAALALLHELSTARERETRAAILIEAGRIEEAEAVVDAVSGEDVTAEILRLRSIVALLRGRLRDALSDARSAVERAPAELAPLLALATARFYSALADGVRPHVGRAPEPMQPGLLRDGDAARTELSRAADDFERAAIIAEDRIRPDVEIWRLAALLLNPSRFEEGAAYAEALLERPLPEPLAVAWASQFGLVGRPGRLKRLYHIVLREGRATETHLVVLALLCAGNDRPKRGLAQIRRYEGLFPDAAAFLEGWRAQFGDAGARGGGDYSAAARAALHSGDNGALIALAVAAGAAPETVLAVAELLTWRKAWRDLDRLRAPLSAMATPRAVELAAVGALRAEDPEGSLRVLEEGVRSMGREVLPRTLVHLRIAANEALGRHEPVLSDLLSLRRDGNDAFAQARILDAYVRIGDLGGARQETERALDRGDLDPRQALGIAQALRSDAPETARRALRFATRAAPAPETAGAIAGLAAELGLADLREEMLRVVLTDPVAGRTLTRFDRVEDALAFVERLSRDHRERFGEWLRGRTPLALVTASNVVTFGRAFLAEAPFRKDHLGDPFPMLLLSGARRDPAPPLVETTLRMDLSAMLVASRLGILPELEKRFSLQVPLSSAEALIEMEAGFRPPSPEIAASVREALGGRGAIRIVPGAPPSARPVEEGGQPGALDAAVVRGLLERAYLAGHLDRERVDGAATTLAEVTPADLAGGVVLTRSALTRLVGASVLEQVARATPCYLPTGEADQMRRDLADAMEEGRLHEHVSGLRRMLAERLKSGAWTTASAPPANVDAAPMPAHLRCLREVLSAQERDPGRLWIEDRAFSQQRMDGVVHLPDVLGHLADEGIIALSRRTDLVRQARRIGYAFLPLDPSPFVTALEAAPVLDTGLVETPALADLRTWMAQEAALLAHVDPGGEVPTDGPVVGEVRRLLDAWGLARALLARIWKAPDVPLRDREARSAWVWTNVRIDRIVGLPSDATAETRRHFRALHLAYLLDTPLLAMLNRPGAPGAPWREFIAWVMAVFGSPLAEADPQARRTVMAVLAGQLRDLLVPPDDLPAEHERPLKAYLAKLVREFLDLLPDEWSDELMEMPGIRERLGTLDAMVLTVRSGENEEGVQDEALLSDVAEAYGRAAGRSDAANACADFRLVDGRPASIAVAGRHVTLVIEGRRTEIDPLTVALLAPRADERSIPRDEHDRLLDPLGTVTAEALARVVATEGTDARFAALQRILDGDIHRTLTRMGERSRSKGTIDVADFALPEPGSVAAYLRVPLDVEPAGVAAAVLDAVEGPFVLAEVMRRLAGLPYALPNDWLAAKGMDLLAGAARETERASPLLRGLELQVLLTAGAEPSMVDAAVTALLDVVEKQGALFIAVVRHLAAAAARDPTWRGLDARVRIAFLWAYADQVVQHLCPPGHDFRDIARWLEGHTAFPTPDRIGESGAPIWYDLLTVQLSEIRLRASLIARAARGGIGELASPKALEALSRACGTLSPGGWFPHLDLISPVTPAPDGLWPALDPLAADALGSWLGGGHPFSHRTDDGLATALLEAAAEAETSHLVSSLLSNVEVRRVTEATAAAMRATLDAAHGTASFEPDSFATRRVLSVEAGLRALTDDEAGMRAILAHEARRCAARWPGTRVGAESVGGAPAALALLVEVAIEFALRLDRPIPDRFGAFAECVRQIVDAWPECACAATSRLDAAVRLGDSEAAGALWPVLLELRGRP